MNIALIIGSNHARGTALRSALAQPNSYQTGQVWLYDRAQGWHGSYAGLSDGKFGLEVGAAAEIAGDGGARRWGLVQSAVVGSTLADWAPGGVLHAAALADVVASTNELAPAGVTARLAAVFVAIGESDLTVTTLSPVNDMLALVRSLRPQLPPRMPVIIEQLPAHAVGANLAALRSAQQTAAADSDFNYLVNTDLESDYPLEDNDIDLTAAGQINLGLAFGKQALAGVLVADALIATTDEFTPAEEVSIRKLIDSTPQAIEGSAEVVVDLSNERLQEVEVDQDMDVTAGQTVTPGKGVGIDLINATAGAFTVTFGSEFDLGIGVSLDVVVPATTRLAFRGNAGSNGKVVIVKAGSFAQ